MDRIQLQVQYRRILWTCPFCGQEDYEDFNVGKSNVCEHNCSACGKWSNSFKEFGDVLYYEVSEDQVDKVLELVNVTQTNIDDRKKERVDKQVYDMKNPPEQYEPSKEDLEREKAQLEERVSSLTAQIEAKG